MIILGYVPALGHAHQRAPERGKNPFEYGALIAPVEAELEGAEELLIVLHRELFFVGSAHA